MAKQIFVNETEVDNIIEEIRHELAVSKWLGEINIKRSTGIDNRKARLIFTVNAWAKMTSLVFAFSTEVQWHGMVERMDDHTWLVYDIVTFPHEVTSVTVISEQKEYNDWLDKLDLATFNAMRFHGHSHVNMPVSPSGTDDKYRSDRFALMSTSKNFDSFNIFFIMNKAHKWSAEIIDITNNAAYGTTRGEISISVEFEDGDTLENFIATTQKIAVTPSNTPRNTPKSDKKCYHNKEDSEDPERMKLKAAYDQFKHYFEEEGLTLEDYLEYRGYYDVYD